GALVPGGWGSVTGAGRCMRQGWSSRAVASRFSFSRYVPRPVVCAYQGFGLHSPSEPIPRSPRRFARCLKRKLIGRSVWGLDGRQLIEKHRHAAADLVADLADLLDALAR